MKTLSFVTLLFCLFYSSVLYAQDNKFEGTWQLVSGEYINDKKELITYASLGISSQKVISGHHFSFVSLANGEFWAAGTGSYSFTENEYLETPKMASYPLEDGGTYTFNYEFKAGLWHNSRWHGDTRVEYEIWKKVN